VKQSYKNHQQLTNFTGPARRGSSAAIAKNDEEQLSMKSIIPRMATKVKPVTV
jgi:hypothetical protein